jgi:PAS domain S-box-containing protein
VDPRLYTRLLIRLLGVPIAALTVLALILAAALGRVEQSARAVDHSDQIIAHANRLTKLFVDQETGLRGYLVTHDSSFLQPFHEAAPQIEPEFDTLIHLVNDPDQKLRLEHLRGLQQSWEDDARLQIQSFPPPEVLNPLMLDRKRRMDELRAQIDDFIHGEEDLRAHRSVISQRVNSLTRLLLVGLAAIAAGLIAWITQSLFRQTATIYNLQLEETRRRSEESFAREQWLNTTLRSIGDAVIACDQGGRIVFMNPVAEDLTGWPEADARNLDLNKVFRIFNEETRAIVESPVDKVRRLGTVVGLANHTFLIAKDGTEVCIDDSGAPIRDSKGELIGIVLVFRDISERRLSEGALMRAEKLAAVGRMAASVAHEVNNPLEGLTNLVYLARNSENIDQIRNLLHQAEDELGRIAHITRQSLGFYREQSAAIRFKPATLVREVTDFYSSRARALRINLVATVDTDIELVGYPGELRQVLANLITNSLDACSSGSIVRINVNTTFDPRNPARQGVRITVADSGSGIRTEHLESIFEPFFTTKKDTGTGLGLWVSRELVHKHGGSVRVRSRTIEPRCGTVFSIFLPLQNSSHAEPIPNLV